MSLDTTMLAYEYTSAEEIPDWFWEIIDAAHSSKTVFRSIIANIPDGQLYKLEASYGGAALLLRDDQLFGHRNYSDGVIDDFTKWLVSRGKEYYMDIWKLRKKLPEYMSDDPFLFTEIILEYVDRFGDIPSERETEGAVRVA